jgi:hypothetical protein
MTGRTEQRLAVMVLAVVLTGCASMESMQRTVSETFGGEDKAAATAAARGEVFYVGRDGLKLYEKPSASSAVLTTLHRNQQVTRYGLERGYADVQVAGTGVRGWVDNAQLAVRKVALPEPAQAQPAVEPPTPAPQPAAGGAAEAPPAQAADADAEAEAPAQPAPPPAAPVPAKAAPPDAVTPSVFDPF